MSDEDLPAALRATATDHIAKTLRGMLGTIPGAGSLVAELVDVIIPNQRSERFIRYVAGVARRLAAAVSRLEDLERLVRASGPARRALFEDGARAAVRALSEERIETIARIVAEGMTADEADAERERAIVEVLDQLSDSDVSYLLHMAGHAVKPISSFPSRPPPGASPDEMQAYNRQLREVHAMAEYQTSKLARLGLLAERPQKLTVVKSVNDELVVPPGQTGGYSVTPMAALLLQRLLARDRSGADQ